MTATPAPPRAAYIRVGVAATMWGTWTLILRPAHLDPRWSTAIIFVALSVFAVPLLVPRSARGAPDGRPRGRADVLLLLVLGIGDAANAALFFAAMSRTTVALAVLSHYLAPMLVPLMAPAVAGTAHQRGALGRAAIGLAGLAIVLEPWRLGSIDRGQWIGAALGAGSAVFYAFQVCLARRALKRFTPEEQLVYHSWFSLALMLAICPWGALPAMRGSLLVLAGGVVIGVTGGVLFLRGVAKVPPEHASLLTFLEPLTAVAIGALVFGESLRWTAAIGAALILGSGIAAVRNARA